MAGLVGRKVAGKLGAHYEYCEVAEWEQMGKRRDGLEEETESDLQGRFLGLEHRNCWPTEVCVGRTGRKRGRATGEEEEVVVVGDGG